MKMDEKVFEAFTDISKLCILELGDDVKNDLITVGRALLPTEGGLEKLFPEFFEREEDKIESEENEEDENLEQEENEIEKEEETN